MNTQHERLPAHATNYVKSHSFEDYIKLARLCETDEHGAHNSYMNNLLEKEQGGFAPYSQEKHLAEVKKHMVSATKYAIDRQMEQQDKDLIKSLLSRIEHASTAQQLLDVCEDGIEVLLKYKNW